jgi:hypothetical protein
MRCAVQKRLVVHVFDDERRGVMKRLDDEWPDCVCVMVCDGVCVCVMVCDGV